MYQCFTKLFLAIIPAQRNKNLSNLILNRTFVIKELHVFANISAFFSLVDVVSAVTLNLLKSEFAIKS